VLHKGWAVQTVNDLLDLCSVQVRRSAEKLLVLLTSELVCNVRREKWLTVVLELLHLFGAA
jgi:hypothetical protein